MKDITGESEDTLKLSLTNSMIKVATLEDRTSHLQDLPLETLSEIASHLDFEGILSLQPVKALSYLVTTNTDRTIRRVRSCGSQRRLMLSGWHWQRNTQLAISISTIMKQGP